MKSKVDLRPGSPIRFIITFLVLFLLFYYFNLGFFGITSKGNHYNAFLDDHLNYIAGTRWLLLHISAWILNHLGFTAIVSNYELLVAGHGLIKLMYTCIGLGVISFFAAFVLAYPKTIRSKITMLAGGILGIQTLNIIRLMLLALYWDRSKARIIDHHIIFDVFIYIVIAFALYFWVNSTRNNRHAAN